MNRKCRRRKQVLVEPKRRQRHAITNRRQRGGYRHARRRGSASGDEVFGFVEKGQLTEFVELKRVVLEDPILLPLLQACVLKIRGERFQNFSVADNVAT